VTQSEINSIEKKINKNIILKLDTKRLSPRYFSIEINSIEKKINKNIILKLDTKRLSPSGLCETARK
jgi:hypothetical protein